MRFINFNERLIIKKGLYYCIIEVKHLKIKSKILNKEVKIKVTYDCIVKTLKNFIIIFF